MGAIAFDSCNEEIIKRADSFESKKQEKVTCLEKIETGLKKKKLE